MKEFQVKQLVRKMLDTPNQISDIEISEEDSGSKEYYFYFPEKKFYWSILQRPNGRHGLFYYPSANDKFNYLNVMNEEADDFEQNLKELFEIVHTRAYGFDDVLNQILNS